MRQRDPNEDGTRSHQKRKRLLPRFAAAICPALGKKTANRRRHHSDRITGNHQEQADQRRHQGVPQAERRKESAHERRLNDFFFNHYASELASNRSFLHPTILQGDGMSYSRTGRPGS